mmetsp:Transcript_20796/g.45811  ORF Transcript_20796/g.45811 Transcript_20796/m.45811 type:complete len:126 (+) Transcript_20796:223-600(+)
MIRRLHGSVNHLAPASREGTDQKAPRLHLSLPPGHAALRPTSRSAISSHSGSHSRSGCGSGSEDFSIPACAGSGVEGYEASGYVAGSAFRARGFAADAKGCACASSYVFALGKGFAAENDYGYVC